MPFVTVDIDDGSLQEASPKQKHDNLVYIASAIKSSQHQVTLGDFFEGDVKPTED